MVLLVALTFSENVMKNIVLASALIAAVSVFSAIGASAANSTGADQQMTTSNPMDAQAKMMMSKKKKMMMMKKKKMMMKKDGM